MTRKIKLSNNVRLLELSMNHSDVPGTAPVVRTKIGFGASNLILNAEGDEIRLSLKLSDYSGRSERLRVIFSNDGIEIGGVTVSPKELLGLVAQGREVTA